MRAGRGSERSRGSSSSKVRSATAVANPTSWVLCVHPSIASAWSSGTSGGLSGLGDLTCVAPSNLVRRQSPNGRTYRLARTRRYSFVLLHAVPSNHMPDAARIHDVGCDVAWFVQPGGGCCSACKPCSLCSSTTTAHGCTSSCRRCCSVAQLAPALTCGGGSRRRSRQCKRAAFINNNCAVWLLAAGVHGHHARMRGLWPPLPWNCTMPVV